MRGEPVVGGRQPLAVAVGVLGHRRERVAHGAVEPVTQVGVMGVELFAGGGEAVRLLGAVCRQRGGGVRGGRAQALVEVGMMRGKLVVRFAEPLVQLVGVRGHQRHGGSGAGGEPLVHRFAVRVERARGVGGRRGEALVQSIRVRAQRGRDLVRGRREPVVQRGAVLVEPGGDAAVRGLQHLGEVGMGGIEAGRGGLRLLGDQRGGALTRPGDIVVQGLAVDADDLVQPVAGLGEAHREGVATRDDLVGDTGAGRIEAVDDVVGAQAETGQQRLAGGGDLGLDAAGLRSDRARHVLGRLAQALDHLVAGGADVQRAALAGGDERRADLVALGAERAGDAMAGLVQGGGQDVPRRRRDRAPGPRARRRSRHGPSPRW